MLQTSAFDNAELQDPTTIDTLIQLFNYFFKINKYLVIELLFRIFFFWFGVYCCTKKISHDSLTLICSTGLFFLIRKKLEC